MRERILIVSDEQQNASMRESLAQDGFSVTVADDDQDGYGQLLESSFDLVIVNLSDSMTGRRLVKQIRANPQLRGLLILTVAEWGTGQPTMALTEGADGFEPSPVDSRRLMAAVTRLLEPNLTMTARAKRG
jgi:DNA-binding response OmpR family regulator